MFKMAKMNRGRFTISANIILTALVITRVSSIMIKHERLHYKLSK